jgi:hypothetical protein
VRIQRIFLLGLVLTGVPAACGGAAPKEPASAEQEQNEEKAERLLARARETQDAERYRQLVLRFGETRAAAEARNELAVILIKQAKSAAAQKDWSTAEARAEEARIYGGLELTREAQAVQKQMDDERAEQLAAEAKKLADEGKCASALKTVAVPVRQKSREYFKTELRNRAQAPLVACLSHKLEQEVSAGNVDAARTMLSSPDTTSAFNTAGYREVELALQKAIVKQSTGAIQPLLAQQKWTDAIAKLDEMQQKGTLGKAEYPLAFELVQDAIRDHLLKVAKDGLTAAKPSEVAKQVSAQIAIAKWKLVPKELKAAQAKLAVAVECEEQRCKLGNPAPAWAWGAIPLHPAGDSSAAPISTVKHAQKVWMIGKGKQLVLLATEDPAAASGAELIAKAAGWAIPKNLKSVDTEMWLPPDEQLAGVQVWGPLRPPSADYLLGAVAKVDGQKVSVKRMADGREESVDLKDLRIGNLKKGLRVMAFCVDPLKPEPAKVDSVVTTAGGNPKVKVICDKGDVQKVEVAGALTSKPEWLPPRKP